MGSTASAPIARASTEKRAVPTHSGEIDSARGRLAAVQASYSHLNIHDSPSDGSLALSQLANWEDAVSNDPAKRLARVILSKTSIVDALVDPAVVKANSPEFNTKIHEANNVTNQHASGRCWLFATMNCARLGVMQKYSLDDFELSQSYLFFYDKLEKSNYFLESMIELAKEPLNSRICQTLLQDLGNDGGQYDMASNVIELYGMVPKTVYPESFNSSNSGKVNALLSTKLREFACEIRAAFAKFEDFAAVRFGAACSASEKRAYAVKACRAMKDKQMAQVYSLLSIALGAPPRPDEAFKWEFHDKTGKFQSWEGTPLDFYRASGFKAADGISLVHDPRHDPYQVMTVDRLGNVWTGRPVRYVNTKIEDMLDVTVSLLKQGKPVWFGCDVGQSSNSTHGLMVAGLHDFKDAFGGAPSMDKAERLNTGASAMTHAMVIVAVHLDRDGKPLRFRVENSWGPDLGDHGYFTMDVEWFRQFVYQVVAPRSLVPKKLKDLFENGEALQLDRWDPFGSLAFH